MTRREAREEAFFIIFEHSFSGEQVDDIIANAVEGRSLQIYHRKNRRTGSTN